uniref:NADH dehydrogenase subunit 2 n=1 Tax=Apsilochorema nigrum TaxID=1875165 RepID=UPI0022DCE2E1|nr:NADH dehydrogenase subunit 2 [Apsilochorema nigrum]UZZ43792.1 NADH dehydrogenase subunit 2 [Apsilochorema nigrum]
MFLKMNLTKMFFILMLIFSTLMIICSNSWISIWIGLEINLLSFIPQMMSLNNQMTSESSMKYFLIQSIASINFLFSIIIMFISNMNINSLNFIIIMLNLTLLLKMGAAPFHSWFPKVMKNLSWFNCFILSTWQKIAPMIIISFCLFKTLIFFFIITSVIVGSIMGISQMSLRNMMSYSSINHLGWMLTSIIINNNLFNFYLFIYVILNMNIMMMFNLCSFSYLNQIFSANIYPQFKNIFFYNMLSLGGLPPFLGFLPKWLVINFLSNSNMQMICIILMMTALINLFYYIRLMFSSFMLNYFENKWYQYKISPYYIKYINFMTVISILSLILVNLIYNI